jgi:hypothetical protein
VHGVSLLGRERILNVGRCACIGNAIIHH